MRKPTIYEALWEKLGRRPTDREASDEVKRILFGGERIADKVLTDEIERRRRR